LGACVAVCHVTECTSTFIAAEERHYKLLADMEERKAQRGMAFRVEERKREERVLHMGHTNSVSGKLMSTLLSAPKRN